MATLPVTVASLTLVAACEDNDVTMVGSERRYSLEIDGIWSPADFTGAYAASLETYVEFEDFKVYAFDSFYRVSWSAINWYVEGALHDSEVAGTYDGFDPLLTPTSCPVMGVPPLITPVAGLNPMPVYPPPVNGNFSGSSRVDCEAGWSFRQNGVWYTLPVTLEVAEYVEACSCEVSPPPTLSCTNTDNAQLSAHVSIGSSETSPGVGFAFQESSGSALVILPDLEKSVVRNEEDYRALIYRGGQPQTRTLQSAVCTHDQFSETGETVVTYTEVHPEQSEILGTVGPTPHAMEDTFGYSTFAPYSASTYRIERTENFTGTFCEQAQNVSFAWNDLMVQRRADNPDILPDLDNASAITRYVNTWANPHWSFFYWFPPDESGAPQAYEWELEGARANPTDYWLPARTQWLSHPALSVAEDRQTRTDLVSAPLTGGAFNGYVNSIFGQFSSWWGISRFDVLRPDYYGIEIALDSASEPGWTETDCVATFGASITVNPSASPCELEYDLGRFTEAPYQAPHLAKSIRLHWDTANVSNIAVYFVGVDGEEVLITDNVEGDFEWPLTGNAVKYAGSYGQDFGFGFTANDQGADTEVEGISAATLADAERNSAFQLLPGRTAAKLKFVIEATDTAVDVTIEYPEFLRADGDAVADRLVHVVETAFWANLLMPNGPGVRWGQLNYWDYGLGAFQDPPEVAAFAEFGQRTVLDALCWVNHFLKGESADTDVDSDLAALYDSVEGQSREDASDWTFGILWPLRDAGADTPKGHAPGFLLVNTFREVPPMAHIPRGSRAWATALVEQVEDFAQVAVSIASEPRYIVAPDPNHLHQDEDSPRAQWTTPSDRTLSGWKISEHTHVVDNTEEDAHILHRGGADLATASPFHGYFFVGELGQDSDSNVSCDVSLGWRHYRARIEAGEVWLGVAPNRLPLTYDERNTAIPAEWVCIRVVRDSKEQTLILTVEDAGDVKFQFSTDEGASFGMATTIAAGAKPTMVIGRNGLRYYYWIDGTAIKGQIRDSANAVVVSTFTAVASGVDDAGIAAEEFNRVGGGHSIELHYVSAGSVTTVTSPDGQTFS